MIAPVQVRVADIEFIAVDWAAEADRHQPLGARIGEAAKQQQIHHAEHRGGGADADRQRGDRRQAERGRAPDYAQAVARVLRERVQPRRTMHRANGLERAQAAAELARRARAGRLWRNALPLVPVGAHGQVAIDFLLPGGVAREAAPQPVDGALHTNLRTLAMPSDADDQPASLSASRLRPAAVSV